MKHNFRHRIELSVDYDEVSVKLFDGYYWYELDWFEDCEELEIIKLLYT